MATVTDLLSAANIYTCSTDDASECDHSKSTGILVIEYGPRFMARD